MRPRIFALGALLSVPACGADPASLEEPPPPGGFAPAAAATVAEAPGVTQPMLSIPEESPGRLPSSPRIPATIAGPTDLADLPVSNSELPARPIIGGTLLVVTDPHRAVLADPDRDLLSVVDLDDDSLRATVTLDPGDEPARLALGGGSTAYAALRGGAALAVVDLEAGALVARVPTCTGPRGLAYDAERRWVVVACHDGEVLGIDESTHQVAWQRTLRGDLRDVVVVAGQYWVSRFKSAELVLLDPEDESVGGVFVPETILPPTPSSPIPSGPTPSSPGVHEARVLRRLSLDPSGNVVLHHQRANRGRLVTAYYGRDSAGTGAIAHGAVTTFVPATRSFIALGALPNAQAYDIAFSGDGLRLAAVSTGTAGSTLHETLLVSRSELDATAMGDWTTAELPGQATAIAYDARGRLLVQSREPATLQVVGGSSVSLSDESRFDTGHVLFHASTPSGLSCASCHPEGGEDGMTWDFSFGLRQTAPLYIGVLATTPLHWQGELAGMPDLMRNTMTRMQGTVPSDAQAQAVGIWLDGLRPPTRAPSALDDQQQLGQQVFVDAGCAACHSGERFTDNRTHDVGTGGSFQTPSLIGLRHTAPYMHDGCAETLEQRFDDACGGTAHGEFWNLDQDQLAQLVAYLVTL